MENKIISTAEAPVMAADSAAASLIRSLGVGKLSADPVPVPRPNYTTLNYNETHFVVPVTLARESAPDDTFTLPTDPRVAVSGGNNVVMREIADGDIRGTVKEQWGGKDWNVTISGMIITDERATVEEYQRRLVELCEARESLIVTCGALNDTFDITRIAVTGMRFDATDGKDNQLFTITGVSDDSYRLEVD